jgi:hypothetical protein
MVTEWVQNSDSPNGMHEAACPRPPSTPPLLVSALEMTYIRKGARARPNWKQGNQFRTDGLGLWGTGAVICRAEALAATVTLHS